MCGCVCVCVCVCVRVCVYARVLEARDLEIGALNDAKVGRYFLSELNNHNVANNEFLGGTFDDDS